MCAAQLVEQQIIDPNERTKFFSDINVWSNRFALIGQMFLVRHVVRRLGIGISLSFLPIISIASFILLAIDPVIGVIAFVTAARRALGFTFSKPTTDMLYSVVTPEEKYKTKNFIDTAVYRFGDVVGTWTIKLMMGLGMTGVSLVMLPFAVIWAIVSIWLGRDYRRQARDLKESGVV
jgi:AAA family ATP:ADP antiporter